MCLCWVYLPVVHESVNDVGGPRPQRVERLEHLAGIGGPALWLLWVWSFLWEGGGVSVVERLEHLAGGGGPALLVEWCW